MSELLVIQGPPARSEFRLRKLKEQLGITASRGGALYAEFVHLLALSEPLSDDERDRVDRLLRYGPETNLPRVEGELVATIVPRRGSISPWSSKATDIFQICGLTPVIRVERGVRWFMAWPGLTGITRYPFLCRYFMAKFDGRTQSGDAPTMAMVLVLVRMRRSRASS